MKVDRYNFTKAHINTLKDILKSEDILKRMDINWKYSSLFALFRYKINWVQIKIEEDFWINLVKTLNKFIDNIEWYFTQEEKVLLKEKIDQLNSRYIVDVKLRLSELSDRLEDEKFLEKYSILDTYWKQLRLTKRGRLLNALFDLDYKLAVDYFSSNTKTVQWIVVFLAQAKDDDIIKQESKIVNFCNKKFRKDSQPTITSIEKKWYTKLRLDYIYEMLVNKYSSYESYNDYLNNVWDALEKKWFKINGLM